MMSALWGSSCHTYAVNAYNLFPISFDSISFDSNGHTYYTGQDNLGNTRILYFEPLCRGDEDWAPTWNVVTPSGFDPSKSTDLSSQCNTNFWGQISSNLNGGTWLPGSYQMYLRCGGPNNPIQLNDIEVWLFSPSPPPSPQPPGEDIF